MGWREHEFRIRDLSVGTKQEFNVGDNYIKKLFQSFSGTGLNSTLRVMREFTRLTGREVAMDFYTSFNKSPAKRYQIPGYTMAVPELGNQNSVTDPQLTGDEHTWGRGVDSIFYFPLFHIHTHPGHCSSTPSTADLQHCSNRRERDYRMRGLEFYRHTPSISVITSTYNSHLFYRPTGDLEAYFKFMANYSPTDSLKEEDEVAKKMEDSGAFIAHSCRDSFKNVISREHVGEIADKFQTTVEVTRIR
jgi:hypothetical protein